MDFSSYIGFEGRIFMFDKKIGHFHLMYSSVSMDLCLFYVVAVINGDKVSLKGLATCYNKGKCNVVRILCYTHAHAMHALL